jgi:tetratricopeptide (TPR) repeat protein
MQAQRSWAAAHPDAFLYQLAEAQFAVGEGRFSDAHKLVAQVIATLRRQGLPEEADSMAKASGVNLIEAGDVAAGLLLFHSAPVDTEDYRDLVGLAETGDGAKSLSALQAMIARYPTGTLWNLWYGPRVRAAVALAAHKPGEAIAALEAARPLDARDLDLQKERADAYLADGKPALAEKEYRNILAHPELGAGLSDWPLSWLGLGRALAAEGNRVAAIDAYQRFFSTWAHADPDAMYLKQARAEFETLQAGSRN